MFDDGHSKRKVEKRKAKDLFSLSLKRIQIKMCESLFKCGLVYL